MADTLGQFTAKLESALNLDRAALKRVADAGGRDGTSAVRRAIGDTSMSNWWRRNPIDLTVKGFVKGDDEIVWGPDRKAIGPSSVLSAGHQAYTRGDRRLTGKTSKKTGKALSRRVKRTTGGHGGKGTAPAGHALIAERTTGRVRAELVKQLSSKFRG